MIIEIYLYVLVGCCSLVACVTLADRFVGIPYLPFEYEDYTQIEPNEYDDTDTYDLRREDEEMWVAIQPSNNKFDVKECKASEIGLEYRGTMGITRTGKRCKDWSSMPTWVFSYPRAHLEASYCRNPDGDKGGPWCFTLGGSWDTCKIVACGKYYMSADLP